jgi:hypothetical protein
LAKIPGLTYDLTGTIEGDFDERDLPTEKTISLKIGAQVMLLNNDPYGQWVNGSVGKVVEIEKDKSGEVKTVVVELRDGEEVYVEPFTWEIFEYQYDEKSASIKTHTLGSFTQFPLRLAWAITIHKSQGKTFDRIILDISGGTFSPGQVYVALSRCTTLEGIVLKQPLEKRHIFMDWKVPRFLSEYQYRIAEEKMPQEEKIHLLQEAVEEKKSLEIVYLKGNNEKSRRIIDPLYVGELDYEGKKFTGLQAYCHKRKEIRNFRIDRILDIRKV